MTVTWDDGRTRGSGAQSRGDDEVRAALAWLTHPVSVVALVVLLLNDHVLKRAYGTWWTGKLSDVAGLALAPALLAVLVAGARAGVRRWAHGPAASWHEGRRAPRVPLAVVTTVVAGVGFTVAKATAAGAAVASAAWTVVAGPSVVLRDPTDLLTLPALGVAWWVARVSSRASARTRRSRSLQVWPLVLPLAVLATAATSSTGTPGTRSVDVEDGVVVVGTDGSAWRYRSTDGATWESVLLPYEPTPGPGGGAGADPTATASPAPEDDERCVPGEPDVCFRPVADGVGVERSDDAGGTWQVDWALTDEQVLVLKERWGDAAPLRTHEVAVLPAADGYRVFAANGGDGLAVRHEHGRWERLGTTYQKGGWVAALPGEPQGRTFPLPLGVVVGWLAGLCALAVVGRPAAPDVGSARRGWAVVSGLLAVVAALVAVGLVEWGAVYGPPTELQVVRGAVTALLLVTTVLTALGVGLTGRELGVGACGGAAVGVVAGVATAVVPVAWTDAGSVWVGIAVAVVGTWGAVRLARRRPERAGGGEPGPFLPPGTSSSWDATHKPTP